ncbi:MAG: hypothetical protein AAFN11_21715 [Chloroflexota bacterium]
MADAFWKMCATAVIWGAVVGMLVLAGVFFMPTMGEDAIAVPIVGIIGAIISSGFIWLGGDNAENVKKDRAEQEAELFTLAQNYNQKRKRDRITHRLSDLSDDELIDLRERIQTGDISEDELSFLLQNR